MFFEIKINLTQIEEAYSPAFHIEVNAIFYNEDTDAEECVGSALGAYVPFGVKYADDTLDILDSTTQDLYDCIALFQPKRLKGRKPHHFIAISHVKVHPEFRGHKLGWKMVHHVFNAFPNSVIALIPGTFGDDHPLDPLALETYWGRMGFVHHKDELYIMTECQLDLYSLEEPVEFDIGAYNHELK